MTAHVSIELLGKLEGALHLIAVEHPYAYLTEKENENRLVQVRISNPARLEKVAVCECDAGARFKAVSGAIAYVAAEEGGLELLDISSPGKPQKMGALVTPYPVCNVTLRGPLAFLTDLASLRLFDVSNPRAPTEVGVCNALEEAGAITIDGDHAYIAADYGMRVVTLANRSAPKEVAYLEVEGNAVKIAVAGNQAYIADADAGGVHIVDVSQPDAPFRVGRFGDWIIRDVAVARNGRQVYLAGGTLDALDVSNPAAPVLAGRFRPGPGTDNGIWEIHLLNELLFAAGGDTFFTFVLRQ